MIMKMKMVALENNCLAGRKHSPITDTETGEVCCKMCGVVIIEKVAVSEYAFGYNGQDKRHNQGSSNLMGELGLGSVIKKGGNASNKLNYTQRMIRLNTNHTITLIEFSKAADKLNMPDYVIEDAVLAFTKHKKDNHLKGLNRRTLVGAYCYLFAKKNGLNITLSTISSTLIIDQSHLYKYYKNLCKIAEIDSSMLNINLPSDYMQKLFSMVKLDLNTKKKCMNVVSSIEKQRLHVGRHPVAVAGTSLYIGCLGSDGRLEKMSMISIAKLINMSEATIKNMFKEFKDKI